jgi:hypothetical protein
VLWTLLAVLFASGVELLPAEEPVSIASILADPDGYHLRVVLLHGTVREVQVIEPYQQSSGAACYGAYSFVLGDHTGAIDVTVLGLCGVPVSRAPEVVVGDEVLVEAEIQAPGHGGLLYGADRRPVPGEDGAILRALARTITPTVKHFPGER